MLRCMSKHYLFSSRFCTCHSGQSFNHSFRKQFDCLLNCHTMMCFLFGCKVGDGDFIDGYCDCMRGCYRFSICNCFSFNEFPNGLYNRKSISNRPNSGSRRTTVLICTRSEIIWIWLVVLVSSDASSPDAEFVIIKTINSCKILITWK